MSNRNELKVHVYKKGNTRFVFNRELTEFEMEVNHFEKADSQSIIDGDEWAKEVTSTVDKLLQLMNRRTSQSAVDLADSILKQRSDKVEQK